MTLVTLAVSASYCEPDCMFGVLNLEPFFVLNTASKSIELNCDSSTLQGLCPSDNEPRNCTCVVTSGDRLTWLTTQRGVFTAPISFSSTDLVGKRSSAVHAEGIIAELTNNTEGHLTSTLTFTPSATELTVTCKNPTTHEEHGKTLTVTHSGRVGQYLEY